MSPISRLLPWAVIGSSLFATLVCGEEPTDTQRGAKLFLQKVQPLFVAKCGACHGERAQEIKGGFDMRSRATLIRGGESAEAAILFDQPEQSPLLLAVQWQDGVEMPPKENDRLTEEQVGWIRQWIEAGAPWPEPSPEAINKTAWSEPDSQGGVRVRTSGGRDTQWTNRRYQPADLWAFQPLRKVSPPTSTTARQHSHPIDLFIDRAQQKKQISPGPQAAPATLIRRATFDLTGLPPTREEVAAFAADPSEESYQRLLTRLLASPRYGERMAQHWLDVVRYADSNGFARDDFRPEAHKYRTYVINAFNEDKPYDRFIREQIAGDQLGLAGQEALAFLWMGPWEHTAMSVAAVTRQLWLDDVTNSVGVTFLGQQLRCAKCHDHKFDPIPTRDYYSMQALFVDTKHSAGQGKYKITSQKPQAMAILDGGSLDSPADEVSPGALSVLSATADLSLDESTAGRRARLANWIASVDNPLTARVMVNRVWQMHFGRGLVATPNDFGKMGADPTHPELLDWLAAWLIEHDWSIKKLHRLIMTSETYRRTATHPESTLVAERDPNNLLLSFFPPRRLTAEEIRDAMLAISGELTHKVGGPSIYPEMNWEVAFQPRLQMGKVAAPYEPSPKKADRNRRSIYAVRLRNLGHPFMEVLNRPGSELSCERRDETTVTPQVFTMLHGEFTHERALALAARLSTQVADPATQVKAAFQAVYARSPSAEETAAATDHLRHMTRKHQQLELTAEPLPAFVMLEEVLEKTGEPKQKRFELKNLQQYENDLKPWEVEPSTRALADLCLVLFNSSEFLFVY